MADVSVGMVDPWGQVVRECEAGNLPELSIALTYAFGLRQSRPEQLGLGDPDVRRANTALVDRFGEKGRERVKKLAWGICEGKIDPATGRKPVPF